MPRSISAPIIAVCWWRVRPATASAWSTPSRASSGSARASPASGRISDAAIERAVDALAICRNKMRNRGVTRARLIATEACRAAENGEDFRARVADKLGLELEVIDRETEATLAATGCTPLIDPQAEGVVLFDIGGGSSELVRLSRSQATPGGPPLPQIARLDLAAARRGDAGRAPRRPQRQPRDLRGHGARGGGIHRAVCARARRRRLARHAHARHLRHGDDHRRRASQSQALRPQPGRRLLDERAGDQRGGREAARHEL